jgi:hypothetical protein
MATKKERCEGTRRGFHRGAFGAFRCARRAKGTLVTNVGFSQSHPCCGDDACVASIGAGYPAEWRPFEKKA